MCLGRACVCRVFSCVVPTEASWNLKYLYHSLLFERYESAEKIVRVTSTSAGSYDLDRFFRLEHLLNIDEHSNQGSVIPRRPSG